MNIIAFIILAQLIGLAIPVSKLPRISTVLDQSARLTADGGFLADLPDISRSQPAYPCFGAGQRWHRCRCGIVHVAAPVLSLWRR